MKSLRLAWGILALACFGGMVRAEVPPIIRFQGVLTDTNSVPLSDESVVLTFRLFDSLEQGTQVWTQTFDSVPVRDGFYEAALGDLAATQSPPLADVAFDRPYFLEITFQRANQAPVTLGPRKALGSVPYSMRSGSSDQLSGQQGDSVAVLPGGGLELQRSGDPPLVELGIAPGGVDNGMVRDSALTAAKIARDEVVTALSFSEPGNRVTFRDGVELEAGANIDFVFPPTVPENTVRIVAQLTGGGGGDVDTVNAGRGLQGSGTGGPEVDLWVGQGIGLRVTEDSVSVDVGSLAGDGLVTDAGRTALEVDTTWANGRYVRHDEPGSVTAGMIVPDIVSSLSGVKGNGAGDIDIVGTGIITVTPDPLNNRIEIDATGGNGDITAVFADNGLAGTATGGDAHLDVIVGRGLEIFADSVRMDLGYADGRFVNQQTGAVSTPLIADLAVVTAKLADDAVTSAKIEDDTIGTADVAVDIVSSIEGVHSDGGNIRFVAGPNITITPDDGSDNITFSTPADGNSLDTLDGSLQDVVRVDSVGRVGVNVPLPLPPQASLHVRQGPNVQGIRIERNDTPDHWETSIDQQLNYSFLFNDVLKGFIEFGTGIYVNQPLPPGAQPLASTLEKVLRLKPSVSGQPGAPASAPASVGLMAEDVAAVFPEIVRERGGFQGLDYSAVSVLAIRAIQEQQALIEEQRAEIAELRRALDLQEQRLASLESGR